MLQDNSHGHEIAVPGTSLLSQISHESSSVHWQEANLHMDLHISLWPDLWGETGRKGRYLMIAADLGT